MVLISANGYLIAIALTLTAMITITPVKCTHRSYYMPSALKPPRLKYYYRTSNAAEKSSSSDDNLIDRRSYRQSTTAALADLAPDARRSANYAIDGNTLKASQLLNVLQPVTRSLLLHSRQNVAAIADDADSASSRKDISKRSRYESDHYPVDLDYPSSNIMPDIEDNSIVEDHPKNSKNLNFYPFRGKRPFEVPQIECPPASDGVERFACPVPDQQGRYLCIDDHVLCDGYIDCPKGEDEDGKSCLFYKTTKAHLDVIADALLRWARGR